MPRMRTFALICLAAAALLTWMIFWMRAHARSLKGELEGQVQRAMNQSVIALALVAFVSVAREGLETALFLVSTTSAGDGREVLAGGLIGPGDRHRARRGRVPRQPGHPDEALLPGDRRADHPVRRRAAVACRCSSSRPPATWAR